MQLSDNDQIAITEWAKACPLIAEVRLYGSRAKGNSRDDSDIDLAVITVGDTVGGRERVLVRRADSVVRLVRLAQKGFFARMRDKLHWGDLSDRERGDGAD